MVSESLAWTAILLTAIASFFCGATVERARNWKKWDDYWKRRSAALNAEIDASHERMRMMGTPRGFATGHDAHAVGTGSVVMLRDIKKVTRG